MSRFAAAIVVSTCISLVAATGQGQDSEPSAYEHLKDLECFIGTWEGKSVIPESPAGSDSLKKWAGDPVSIRVSFKWSPGKNAQIAESVFEVPGKVKILGSAIRGWDQSTGRITEHSFTTHEGVWSATCEKAGDAWVFKHTGSNLDGGKCTFTRTIVFEGKNAFVSRDTDQTINGKPFPDMECRFKRTAKKPQISNYERLKGIDFLIGDWEARNDDGGTTRWSFNWADGKNGIQNVITVRGPDGKVAMSNMGIFAWDPTTRRITNWCITEKGNRVQFLWAQRADGKWETWPPGSGTTWVNTVVDKDTWTMEGSGGTQVFKRVK